MKENLRSERKKLLSSVERLLEGPMVFLGFVWLILLVIELVWGLSRTLEYLSVAIWGIFIFDFLLKFFLAPIKLRFLKTNWLTAISLVIPAIRLFRLLRILRLLRGVRLIKIVASLNRSMKSLGATMKRRGFAYVLMLALVVTFGGAAGMFAIENGNPGFENFGMALWWTAMRVITAGSDFWPATAEGRGLAFILSLFGYGVFGYVTATLATFFIGRDAEEKDTPVAGAKEVDELKQMIISLTEKVDSINKK
ncbi:MAG: potassium channel protein [Chitinophagaceae bacterium]|nr:MAG: potassium channel protein [Chitinophagaceae bacterium]